VTGPRHSGPEIPTKEERIMWTTLSRMLDRVIGLACQAVLYLTTGAIFVILSANVILRYTTGTSLQWASEVPELLFPWLVVAGIVLAVQHGTHISVVLLTQRLPEAARRWVFAGGGLVVVALYLTLAWAALQLMPISADELSPMLQVPGSVTVSALLLGFVLIAVLTLVQVVNAWAGLATTHAETAASDHIEGVHQ
jgi:TRAP-type C4-dicarboxylate transport system permease small subunit